jgi:hypothetical protein
LELPIRFTDHALDAYRSRVRVSASEERARAELAQLLREGTVQPDPPPWVTIREQRGDQYLVLTDDLACPLVANSGELVAVTLLARGAISETERRGRSDLKAAKRRAKRVAKTAEPAGRPPRAPDAGEWGS